MSKGPRLSINRSGTVKTRHPMPNAIHTGYGVSPMRAPRFRLPQRQTSQLKKEKKMNWFKRIIARWVRDIYEYEDDHNANAVTSVEAASPNAKTSIRFTLYPASGGWVIEHFKQDRYKDSEGPSLTIINHGEEIGKAVEHIVSMESLRS